MSRYILLWLEGPLQAWGYDSLFGVRSTLDFPTKSGVLGMILAALGMSGPQEELLRTLSKGEQTVFSFKKSNRVSASTMVDFHMVGNGYDSNDAWENLNIPKKRDGTKATGAGSSAGSKITYRHYLQDAVFAVVAEIPEELSSAVESAFSEPVWPLCLGRRCCVPSKLIYRGSYSSLETAADQALSISDSYGYKLDFKAVEGQYPDEGEVLVLRDVPLSFGEHKKYESRYVTLIKGI